MNRLSVACVMDKDQDLGSSNNNILGTKTLTWTNVPFKHEGNYDIVFMGDDEAKFYINDELILNSKWGEFGDEHAKTRSFTIKTPGNYDIKVELDNTATHSNIFYDNPTGVVLEITKPLDLPTYDVDGVINSDSWQKNPMGVSMECVPPPCPKLETGIGQVGDVIITEPGNKYIQPTGEGDNPSYETVTTIETWIVVDGGTNYSPTDKFVVDIPGTDPIETEIEVGGFGEVEKIIWPPPEPGPPGPPGTPPPSTTRYPSWKIVPPGIPLITPITPPGTATGTGDGVPPPPGIPGVPPPDLTRGSSVPPGQPPAGIPGVPPETGTGDVPTRPAIGDSSDVEADKNLRLPTGVNAKVIPVIRPTVLLPDGIDPRTGMRIPSNQIIQVTDLVGIKQTGWYNGKEYYGAVFYKDGVRYAGYYETAGVLIRVYSTKQESIDSQVTTPPSAILRQGTDVSSNDPRLNIPGTPQ